MDTVKLGILEFDYPLLMLAAGMCKSLDMELVQRAAYGADAIVPGSITPLARTGNNGNCEDLLSDSLFGLNSWGMPNSGVESDIFEAGKEGPCYNGSPTAIVSVAGFCAQDYLEMFTKLAKWGDGIELNFGCPNIRDDGKQHKIASFDPQYLFEVLDLLFRETVGLNTKVLGVKLSPYSDPGLLKEVASILGYFRYPDGNSFLDYVASCNAFPNGLGFDQNGKPRISTVEAGDQGGVSGEALKPISLGNAAQLRRVLPEEIAVLRVGGVSTGRDVWESYQVGCAGVQIATAYAKEGPQVFTRIRKELVDIHTRLDK